MKIICTKAEFVPVKRMTGNFIGEIGLYEGVYLKPINPWGKQFTKMARRLRSWDIARNYFEIEEQIAGEYVSCETI